MSRPIVAVGGPSPDAPAELGRYAARVAVVRPLTTGERVEIWTHGADGIAIVAVPYRGRSAGGRVVFAATGYRQGAGGGGDLRTAEDAFAFGSREADRHPDPDDADAGITIDRAWWGSALADAAACAVLDAADRAGL